MFKAPISHIDSARQPEIRAERCVHAKIPNARCRACVDVCHAGAWHLDAEQLGIDASQCDGCGLCSAVCPEGAIEHDHAPVSLQWQGQRMVLMVCEKSPGKHSGAINGEVSCIHALSVRELLQLHAAGCRRLLVSTGLCGECPRGETPLLDEYLEQLNALFLSRGEEALLRVDISPAQGMEMIRSADSVNAAENASRRRFLRRAVSKAGDYGLWKLEPVRLTDGELPALSSWLSDAAKTGVYLHVPVIDTALCSACHACVNLCPHAAISLSEEAPPAYIVQAADCTACGICVDVCEDRAIAVEHNVPLSQARIPLAAHRYRACGAPFYTTETSASVQCRICSRKNHAAQLFQVLD